MQNSNDMAGDDDLLAFDDDQSNLGAADAALPWRILIVDDDEDVHRATEFALRDVQIIDRPLVFLHAYSSTEAIDLLRREPEIAVILLDVVMESEHAGLDAVDRIRGELKLDKPRIILRTGQPGYAPEIETIRRYDINDYKTKNELTRAKMYTALTAAVRSYDQLCRLDASRQGLEQIVAASNHLISQVGLQEFASGVIRQMAAFIGVEPEGMVCAAAQHNSDENYLVIAATGHFSGLIGHWLNEIDDPQIAMTLDHCLREKRNLVDQHSMALFFPGRNGHDFAAYIDSPNPLTELDQHLLEVFCTNITICGDNVKLVEELRNLAYYDPLLGLPNRAYFVEAIDKRLHLGKPEDLRVAMLDVDQFAEINDMFGHQYGDLLLKAIARRLEQHFPPPCVVARISNDTFGLFCTKGNISPERLAPLLNGAYEVENVERPVSMGIGIVEVSQESNGSLLLKDASIAVKRAKENGIGQYAFFSPAVATATRERTRLLQDLRYAFAQDMLFVAYQPQLELATGKVIGVEALMRWRTVDGQLVPPDRFIPIAEQSGLIIGLGTWILRTALHAARRIGDEGFDGIRMAVNVSTIQFRQNNFLDQVDQALRDSQLPAELLELEVTESVAIMGLNFVEEALTALRQRGISVAIDDFGTGYSSLSYLGRLPANRLKIDHSFVWAMDSGKGGVNIPEMVVPLGRQLNMKVIAEGVETEAQAERLRTIGCDEVQGYLYAKPMPLEELLDWLRTRR